MSYPKKRFLPLIAILALLPLASIAHASLQREVEAPPLDYVAESGIAITRAQPIDAIVKLDQDLNIALLTLDVATFCSRDTPGMRVADLARFLSDQGWLVTDIAFNEQEYRYFIDPDGTIHKICLFTSRVEVDDGTLDPMVLLVDLSEELLN